MIIIYFFTAVTNKPPPVQHSLSQPDMKDNNRDGVPTPQQLGLKKTNFKKADPSKGEIMRPTGNPSLAKIKSLDIPSSHLSDVPSPQQMGLRLTKTKRESISEPDQQEVDKAPEIDQSNPGGVSSIKSIFERKPSESDDKQPRQQTGLYFTVIYKKNIESSVDMRILIFFSSSILNNICKDYLKKF